MTQSHELTWKYATPDDAPLLDTLMVRSKASWGYPEEMMALLRPTYGIDTSYIGTYTTVIGEDDRQVVGFYALGGLDVLGEQIELDALFIAPEYIGKGYGKLLWEHAVKAARATGAERMVLTSDPNAEGFYMARGAHKLGDIVSDVIEGRLLPRMVFKV